VAFDRSEVGFGELGSWGVGWFWGSGRGGRIGIEDEGEVRMGLTDREKSLNRT
jgi:hypothetical protein